MRMDLERISKLNFLDIFLNVEVLNHLIFQFSPYFISTSKNKYLLKFREKNENTTFRLHGISHFNIKRIESLYLL